MTSARPSAGVRGWASRLAELPVALVLLLALGLALRLWALGGTGYPSDPREVTRWAEGVAAHGLGGFYENIQGGYYPLILYLLAPLATLFQGDALYVAVKGAVIPFDLLIGVTLYGIVRRAAPSRYALLAAALYVLNPASILGGAYWGQVDAIGALGMLLAIAALGARREALAGAFTVASGLFKATFGIVGLVVAVATILDGLRGGRWRGAALAIAGGLIALALVCVPIRLGPFDYLGLVREGGVRFPFTSLFALNVWFVLVGFFKPDDAFVLPGLALLAAGLALALRPLWRDRSTATLLAVSGAVVLAFYFLPTRVHERYLFPAIVLFAPFAALRPRVRMPYVVLSACFTLGLGYTLWQGSQSHVPLPRLFEDTVYSIYGIGLVAIVLMASSWLLCWRLFHGEARLGLPSADPRSPRRDPARAAAGMQRETRLARLGARLPVLARAAAWLRGCGRERVAAWTLLALVVAFTGVGVSSELRRVPDVNDSLYHLRLVVRAGEALGGAANPIDFWLPELEQGFPVFMYYQQLPHLAVALLQRLLLGLVGLETIFDFIRWLLMTTMPITAYLSLRWAGFPRTVAAVSGAGAALVSSNFAFGLEYDNYLWRGYGLYTQLWGAQGAFIAFAALWRLFRQRGRLWPAVVSLALLALTHLVYGYMAALTAGVLALAGASRADLRRRLWAFVLLGALTAAAALYMLVPFVRDQQYLSVSPYFPRFRFDGFGFEAVLAGLARGDLLDSRRLAVLTVLAGVGAVGAIAKRDRSALSVVGLFCLWLVLLAGKPVTELLPFHGGLPVHRFIGSVQLFGVILAGYGVRFGWDALRAGGGRLARLPGAAAALTRMPAVLGGGAWLAPALALLLLAPVLGERAAYYRQNADWMDQTIRAIERDRDYAAIVARLRELPPGRVHAGMRASWGDQLDFGLPFRGVKLYDALIDAGFDMVRPPAYSFSLGSDSLFFFEPMRIADYRVFGARYVIAPPGQAAPGELRQLLATARYVLYELPDARLGEYVALAGRESVADLPALVTRQSEWFAGAEHASGRYLRIDYPVSGGKRSDGTPGCDDPAYGGETFAPGRLTFTVACSRAATFVMKTSFHPGWQVTSDGVPLQTFMVSPDFLAVELPPGRHAVSARYVAASYKTPLALLGFGVLALTVAYRRRLEGLLERLGRADR